MAQAVAARRAQGLPVLDLTMANPTRCGFTLDSAAVLAPLSRAGAIEYDPQPFGQPAARAAVCCYYLRRGATLNPAQICLTTSTSEAYSFLFRLLCDPGDEVLIANPSYPLFDYLAALDDVRLVSYPLFYEHGWGIEPGAVAARIGPRTRAVVLVHPNNPTGHFVSESERTQLEAICVQHKLALIVDEVFLDYAWGATKVRSFAQAPHTALTFVLSGISKVAALPQMKLSWLATLGPATLREEAQARLEVIADTFLSVSAPIQQAVPAWLAGCATVQKEIRERIAANLLTLDSLLAGTTVSRLAGEGGWYAVLRIPKLEPDEAFAQRLLQKTAVLVHPGSAFGFVAQGWIVISLLSEEAMFQMGIQALIQMFYL